MRQAHRAGEKLFVDYAGQTVSVIDPASGEIRRAQVFVAVPGRNGTNRLRLACHFFSRRMGIAIV